MLLNATTALSTSKVLLVPYSKWHVPRYHEWMKDEEIQEATASEPLTLEEEYAMQQSWRQDPDKLTFIICLPVLGTDMTADTGTGIGTSTSISHIRNIQPRPLTEDDDSTARMIGDINLFLRVDDGDEGAADPQLIGEIELMIAEKKDQRRGFGKAALLAFLRYVVGHEGELLGEFVGGDETARKALAGDGDGAEVSPGQLRLAALSVKIGKANERSLALFEGVGFRRVGEEPNYFGEWELRRTDLRPVVADGVVEGYVEVPYERSG